MMATRGAQTLAEINRQPEAWTHTIRNVEAQKGQLLALAKGVEEVIFTGSGSAYNVSMVLAPTFQHFTGVRARSAPAAELIHFPETVFPQTKKCLVVTITRSGETTEAIGACSAAQERGCRTLGITCHTDSTLVRLADSTLILADANERSVVTTQSLTSMVLCGQVLSALIADDRPSLEAMRQVPEWGRQRIAAAHQLGQQIADNEAIDKFAFVGNGPYLGLARECQLKLKEMVLQPSDAYPLFDFRHGPKSNVDGHMLVTVLVSDRAQREEATFLRDMRQLNGKLLVLCDRAEGPMAQDADYMFKTDSGLPDFAREVLYMPVIHYLAYYRSLALGYDPDNPVNLTYWVDLASS
ncbi:MAG: SIS domain-containing protein [Chloroflexi bacterium]|jgi:glucosamine--fructose-6-phosphate aminotransferase (isomerizing)|nr:SIS domain-containing protein [Chloroflexota bacterium]